MKPQRLFHYRYYHYVRMMLRRYPKMRGDEETTIMDEMGWEGR